MSGVGVWYGMEILICIIENYIVVVTENFVLKDLEVL